MPNTRTSSYLSCRPRRSQADTGERLRNAQAAPLAQGAKCAAGLGAESRAGKPGAALRIEINRYLFYEIGTDQQTLGEDESKVSQSWPFQLREVRSFTGNERPHVRVFRFRYRDATYFVEAGRTFSFWWGEGMSTRDLHLYGRGTWWLASRNPVDVTNTGQGVQGTSTPAGHKQGIREVAGATLGVLARAGEAESTGIEIQILEGLYFPSQNRYLALLEDIESSSGGLGRTYVVGSGLAPHPLPGRYSGAAPWRWFVSAIGGMLERGELHDW